jgi:hypothetical protein
MTTTSRAILLLLAALASLIPAARAEQSQKSSRVSTEDRVKKLEERADAAEKAAAAAAMEKDYIARTQKLYESYYQKTFNIQLWTLGTVGLLLIGVFGLVARFSLSTFEQRTKLATTDATTQIRNEFARILAKESQKLWDSNLADTKKLKESLTAQVAVLEQNLKDMSDFQFQSMKAFEEYVEGRHDEGLLALRKALSAYKSGKPRNLIDIKSGATTVSHIFETLRKKHGEEFAEKTRQELGDTLYSDMQEELGLAALQSPWLTPFINERIPVVPEAPMQEAPSQAQSIPAVPKFHESEFDSSVDEEYDSCRLISS